MSEHDTLDPAATSPAEDDPPTERGQTEGPQDGSAPEAADQPEIVALKRERDDNWDRLLRKTAEFDNYRKRVERERREKAGQAVADVLVELLSVVDDFDRALTVDAGENASAYRKGVELIHTKLHDLLKKYGVRPIEAIGAEFDPSVHQAVATHEVSPGQRDGEVIAEMRRGYMMGDRLLRPASVMVAKA